MKDAFPFQQQANIVLVITLNSLKDYGTVRGTLEHAFGRLVYRPFRIWGFWQIFRGELLGSGEDKSQISWIVSMDLTRINFPNIIRLLQPGNLNDRMMIKEKGNSLNIYGLMIIAVIFGIHVKFQKCTFTNYPPLQTACLRPSIARYAGHVANNAPCSARGRRYCAWKPVYLQKTISWFLNISNISNLSKFQEILYILPTFPLIRPATLRFSGNGCFFRRTSQECKLQCIPKEWL